MLNKNGNFWLSYFIIYAPFLLFVFAGGVTLFKFRCKLIENYEIYTLITLAVTLTILTVGLIRFRTQNIKIFILFTLVTGAFLVGTTYSLVPCYF